MRKNTPRLDTVIELEATKLWSRYRHDPVCLACSLVGMLLIVKRFGRDTDVTLIQDLLELVEHL